MQILGNTDGTINFASTFAMNNIGGTTVDINGDVGGTDMLGGSVTFNNAISNTAGRSVSVQNVASGANISFNGNITDSGDGILVNSNSGGQITFIGDLAMTDDTAASTAVAVTNNTGANIDFAGDVVINSTNGAGGFMATGGGTLSMPSTVNSVSTDTGLPLVINGMTIATGGVNFGDVNRTASAGTNAIDLENNTGGPITIGNTTDTVGDAGTIAGGTVDAIRIVDSANVSITGLRINNTSAVAGVHIEKNTSAAMTTNLSDIETNGGASGINVIGGGSGAVTMTINDTNINSPTVDGLTFNNLQAGTVQVNNAQINGNNVNGTAGGVLITNNKASITFDSATKVQQFGGTDFEVNGGTGSVSYAGSIVNSSAVNPGDTSGQSVRVHNITGGSVTFTAASTITDNNAGMLVDNNGGGSVSFLGTNTFNATTDAVTVSNNDVGGTNTSITFAGLNITTTGTGRGFVAELGGNLSVTGTTNTIHSANGTGLSITDMTIGSVDFNKVTVDGVTGPTNDIVLQNLTGGLVSIGPGTGAVGAGGQLRATGDAIVIQNVQNAMLSQVRVLSAGSASGDNGVEISQTNTATTAMDVTIDGLQVDSAFDHAVNVAAASTNTLNFRITGSTLDNDVNVALSGSGHFGMLVDSTTVTTGNNDVAFSLVQSGSARNADLTFRNNNDFSTGDAQALLIDSAGSSAKTVNLLVQNSAFSNSSAASPTVAITAEQTSLMNNTVQGNTFANSNAGGVNYSTTTNGAAASMILDLGGSGTDRNTASGGLVEYDLHSLGGSTFTLFDKTNTLNNTRNVGTVVPDPNAAAFGDTAVAPPLPTVP